MLSRTVLACVALLSAFAFRVPAQACSNPRPAVEETVRAVIKAVNDGRHPAIAAMVRSTWSADTQATRRIIEQLGVWHWRSRKLTLTNLCALPTSVHAIAVNALTEQLDSIAIPLDPSTGRPRTLAIRYGIRAPLRQADTTSEAARIAAIRRLARRLATSGTFAGVVLLTKDGAPLYYEALVSKYADREIPVDLEDQFSIASTGKIITATAILRLVEQGRLRLDDSLAALLPEEKWSVAQQGVRLKHLLSHTSGLRYGTDTLAFTPGSGFEYSNHGYNLLAQVIERTTGRPFAEHFVDSLFPKANMRPLGRLVAPGPVPTLPGNYTVSFDERGIHLLPNELMHSIPAMGSGHLFMSAMDLARFGEALRSGKLLSLSTVAEMRKPKPELGAPTYGYGNILWRGQGIWGHGGDLPGGDADLQLYGDSGYTFVVVGNIDDGGHPIRRLADALFISKAIFRN